MICCDVWNAIYTLTPPPKIVLPPIQEDVLNISVFIRVILKSTAQSGKTGNTGFPSPEFPKVGKRNGRDETERIRGRDE